MDQLQLDQPALRRHRIQRGERTRVGLLGLLRLASGKQRIAAQKRIKRFEQQLATQDYIAGPDFCIVDITAWCSFRFFRVAGFELGEDQPNLRAWFERIKARPAAAKAFS